MKEERRLQDILAAIDAIEVYAVGSLEEFVQDEKTQDAIMYNLIIMGEAANQLSKTFQENHSSVPWSSIIGTRNVIVHGYDQVKLQIVWEIVHNDLATLRNQIQKVLQE